MDKEVDPAVLALIDEKRLRGDKRTPVEIIAKLGVADARQKASEHAWMGAGDTVVATVWAERVTPGDEGRRWFCIESLEARLRANGTERSALQLQRAEDRALLLKRTFDAAQDFRAVLQTNRLSMAVLEADKDAKVSVRVADDQPWHVAQWNTDDKTAVLVRGARGWQPSGDELRAALARSGVPVVAPASTVQASADEVQAAAMAYLTRHFAGYGYPTEDVSAQNLGYHIEVSDKKGATLLKIAVKGTAVGHAGFQLSEQERAAAKRGDPWRLAVVTDAIGAAAQHKLYKSTEIDSAPGLQP